jgi:sulfhydrogenase subunit delta
MSDKKLRVGWFTFTCCEDSTIVFTELLNTHWQEWSQKIDFVHANVLKSQNRWEPMDVAFVEGAICAVDQETKLRKIRSFAKKIVTIGACACNGMPSGQRNNFDEKTQTEISELLKRFHQANKVKPVKDVVSVDDAVNGCPMTEAGFLNILDKYLKEFNII